MLRSLLACVICCTVPAASGWAASAESAALVDLVPTLEGIRAEHRVAGMVALVLRGDQVVAQGATGLRHRDKTEAITVRDQLHLGSCTKAMTATLAGMLVEEGKLRWTATLGELWGDAIKDMHPAWKSVTLRQLLVHRAGLHRGNDRHMGLDVQEFATGASLPELRRTLARHHLSRPPPEAAPGTQEIYSNVGYVLAGAVLEKIAGRTWEQLMHERIFRPLDLTSGGFGAPGLPGRVDQPWGHDRSGDPIDPGAAESDMRPFAGPCGNVHLTIGDWARFIAVHLRGDPANPHRRATLLNPETLAYLHEASPGETFAPGWAAGTVDFARGSRPGDHGKIFGHEGNNGFWYSKVLVAPEIDTAVLVVVNQGGPGVGGKAVGAAAVELLKTFRQLPAVAR